MLGLKLIRYLKNAINIKHNSQIYLYSAVEILIYPNLAFLQKLSKTLG